ncbi:MAG: hypothetical protein J7J11_01630 [Desulfurococcales archaeon]|nr:hypothetical protein [Desulfurococcales archaeon]
MSFSEGKDVVKNVISRYESIRREAVKKLPQSKSVVFNVIADIMYRVEKALEYLSELEKTVGVSVGQVKKVCGNLYLVRTESTASVLKLKPAQSLTYDGGSNSISLSNDSISVSIQGAVIKFVFRGREFQVNYGNLNDASTKADVVKAVARYVIDLADRLQLIIEQCAKQHNIRI